MCVRVHACVWFCMYTCMCGLCECTVHVLCFAPVCLCVSRKSDSSRTLNSGAGRPGSGRTSTCPHFASPLDLKVFVTCVLEGNRSTVSGTAPRFDGSLV